MSKSVRIGPFDFSIIPMDETDARANYGSFSAEHHEIRLRPTFANRRQWAETLLHEIHHGIWEVQGINSKDGEERIVRATAIGWSCVFRDNQALMAEILKALK